MRSSSISQEDRPSRGYGSPPGPERISGCTWPRSRRPSRRCNDLRDLDLWHIRGIGDDAPAGTPILALKSHRSRHPHDEVRGRQRRFMNHVSLPEELRHRGELVVEDAGCVLWATLGGRDGVEALIADLYRRMAEDEVLRHAFPHFNPAGAVEFFVQWFGGDRAYSDELAGGLVRRHQHRYVSPAAAAAWLRCMREALEARGVEAEPILRPLTRAANALVHSPDTPVAELHRSCGGI